MKIKQYRSRMEIAVDIEDLKYKETHDTNISEEVAGHSKTTTTMNRYAHARHNSTVKSIKALDEAYNL